MSATAKPETLIDQLEQERVLVVGGTRFVLVGLNSVIESVWDTVRINRAAYRRQKQKLLSALGRIDQLTDTQRQTLYTLISQMRDKGNKWEQIARDIASQGYPTVSGKGTWRGAMAKNLYEKMNA